MRLTPAFILLFLLPIAALAQEETSTPSLESSLEIWEEWPKEVRTALKQRCIQVATENGSRDATAPLIFFCGCYTDRITSFYVPTDEPDEIVLTTLARQCSAQYLE